MLNINLDRDEVNTLIAILPTKGVSYLLGSDEPESVEEDIDPVDLVRRLVTCNFPLVEHACISLFLLHPELAPSIVEALQRYEGEVAENLAVITLATLYLQQWWLFRLAFAFGHLPNFPEAPFASLWRERNLPPPDAGYGREGFLSLQEYQQRRYGAPLNFLHDWQNQINHLLAQEEAYHRKLPDSQMEILKQLSLGKKEPSL